MARARPARPRPEQEVAAARPARRRAEPPGPEASEPERRERDPMADLALGGAGDAAAAALDELSRNVTYGAQGAGNGSLSGAWYRRNQVRAGRPPAKCQKDAGRSKRDELTRCLHTWLNRPSLGRAGGTPRASSPAHPSPGVRRPGRRVCPLRGPPPPPRASWSRTTLPFQPESSLSSWKDPRSVGESPPPLFPSGSFYS